jgi:RHS repeat-associated protein
MSRRERKYAVGGAIQTYDFLWDGDDRLHQVKQGVSSRFSATYNGDGLRASKTDLFSATYHFTWGPGGVLYDGATTYTPGLAQRQGTSASRFAHSDWVGSTRYLSDPSGLVMPSALRYDAYGQRTALAGPTYPTPYQFAGGWGYETEYSDASEPYLGLAYVDQRYYEPATGRFISPDPIGLAGGLNLYAYVDNDPVNWVDADGLGNEPIDNRTFDTARQAFRAAKDRAGVPRSQQPSRQWTVGGDPARASYPNYRYSPDRARWGRYQQFETPKGSKVVAYHTCDPAAPLPHFHAGEAPPGHDLFGNELPSHGFDFRAEPYRLVGGKHHLYHEIGNALSKLNPRVTLIPGPDFNPHSWRDWGQLLSPVPPHYDDPGVVHGIGDAVLGLFRGWGWLR